jgi:hypothetical protein
LNAKARKRKAEQTKDAGDPIEVKGKIIRMILRDDEVWTAESGGVARRVDLKVPDFLADISFCTENVEQRLERPSDFIEVTLRPSPP